MVKQHTDQERERPGTLKTLIIPIVPWGEQSTPLRATQGTTSIDHEKGSGEGTTGQMSLLCFHGKERAR